jgi:hypothetical protein
VWHIREASIQEAFFCVGNLEFLVTVFLEKPSQSTSHVLCVLFGPNCEQVLIAMRTLLIVSGPG